MARMYSKRKGKSGSKRFAKVTKPLWVTHEPAVVEQLVVKLAKSGSSSAQIGLILRDSYGIPYVKTITQKPITAIMKEHNVASNLPEDLRGLIKRDIVIMKHRENNKKDKSARYGMQLTESKIGRLITYYKRTGVLPPEWKYDRTKAKSLIA